MAKKAVSKSAKAATKTAKPSKDTHAAEQRKTLMNWFIIVIMLGSVGIALVSNSDGQKPTDTPVTPAPDLAPTIIPFAADNVDAKVEDVFGALVLTASTTQPDLAKIDAQLTGIEGVVRVSSQFRSLEGMGGPQKLTYFAEVTYDNKRLAPPQLLQAIQTQATFLQEVVVYPIGLVSLPATVQLVNLDLNLTKDYRFADQFAQAFLTVETQKGDTIQVHIDADLAGEQVRQMVVYESQNTGTAPQFVSLTGTYVLDALGRNLAVLGDYPYGSAVPGKDALEAEAKAIPSLVTAQLDFANPPLALEIQSTEDFVAKVPDLNQSLYKVPGVLRVRLDAEGKSAAIDFQDTVNYADLKKELEFVFAAQGLAKEKLAFTDPRVRMQGVFDASTEDLADAAAQLTVMFKKHGILAEIYQPATFAAEKFVDPASGNEYVVEGKVFQALVKPGHKIMDPVLLGIQFLGKRDTATSVQAIEALDAAGKEQTIPIKPN